MLKITLLKYCYPLKVVLCHTIMHFNTMLYASFPQPHSFQFPVIVEKKVITVLGFPSNGYIVRRAAGVPRHLPTKDELFKAIQFLLENQFSISDDGILLKIMWLKGGERTNSIWINFFLTVCVITDHDEKWLWTKWFGISWWMT